MRWSIDFLGTPGTSPATAIGLLGTRPLGTPSSSSALNAAELELGVPGKVQSTGHPDNTFAQTPTSFASSHIITMRPDVAADIGEVFCSKMLYETPASSLTTQTVLSP